MKEVNSKRGPDSIRLDKLLSSSFVIKTLQLQNKIKNELTPSPVFGLLVFVISFLIITCYKFD